MLSPLRKRLSQVGYFWLIASNRRSFKAPLMLCACVVQMYCKLISAQRMDFSLHLRLLILPSRFKRFLPDRAHAACRGCI